MSTMGRRGFLRACVVVGAGLAGGAAIIGRGPHRQRPMERYLTAGADGGGRHFVAVYDAAGREHGRIALEGRGHALAVDPAGSGRALAFARRPGRFVREIDLRDGAAGRVIASQPGRHFMGHGVYSPDGQWLYTTENDYEAARGVVVVRDARTLAPIHELESHGVGPHELALLGDGRTLVVANGGIHTHPSQPREKLNIGTMQPNLAYLDLPSGRLLSLHRPSDPQLSIRHLAVDGADRVAVAMQYEGTRPDGIPLLARHAGEDALVAMDDPAFDWRSMNHYVGSVAVDPVRGIAAVTSPRAHRFELFDLREGRHLGGRRLRDVCGVAWSPRASAFIVSTGQGRLAQIDPAAPTGAPLRVAELADARCDNHLCIATLDA